MHLMYVHHSRNNFITREMFGSLSECREVITWTHRTYVHTKTPANRHNDKPECLFCYDVRETHFHQCLRFTLTRERAPNRPLFFIHAFCKWIQTQVRSITKILNTISSNSTEGKFISDLGDELVNGATLFSIVLNHAPRHSNKDDLLEDTIMSTSE